MLPFKLGYLTQSKHFAAVLVRNLDKITLTAKAKPYEKVIIKPKQSRVKATSKSYLGTFLLSKR